MGATKKGEAVIDLDQMVERFLGEAVEFFKDDFPKYGSPVIDALRRKARTRVAAILL